MNGDSKQAKNSNAGKLLLYRIVNIMFNKETGSWEAWFINFPIVGDAYADGERFGLPINDESASDLTILAVVLELLPGDEWFMLARGAGGTFYTRDGDIVQKGIAYEDVYVTVRRPVSNRKEQRIYDYYFPVSREEDIGRDPEEVAKEKKKRKRKTDNKLQ